MSNRSDYSKKKTRGIYSINKMTIVQCITYTIFGRTQQWSEQLHVGLSARNEQLFISLMCLSPALDECRMTCNWFCRAAVELSGQAIMSVRCGRGSSDGHRIGRYRRHIDDV